MTPIGYWVVLTCVALVVIGTRQLLLRRRVDGPLPDGDPHALAMIAGGPRRLAAVVIVEMVRAGQLRVERGWFRVVGGGDAVTDPLRLAVLSAFRDDGVRHGLLRYAGRRPEVRSWEPRLRRARLVATPGRRLFARLVPLPLLVTTLGFEIAFSRAPSTVENLSGAFLAPLTAALLITSIVMIIRTPFATPLGRRLLRRARRAQRSQPTESVAVALQGKTAIEQEGLRTALYGSDPPSD